MTIIECTPADAFDDEVTTDMICVECQQLNLMVTCELCGAPLCALCHKSQLGLCAPCTRQLVSPEDFDEQPIDMDRILDEMGL